MGCRNPAKGRAALESLQAKNLPGTISLLDLDITSDDSINAAYKKLESEFGVLDVLVNNAGIVVQDPSKSMREATLETFNANTVGPQVLTATLAPLLKKSKDPRVINVTSELGSITQRADVNGHYYALPADAYRMSKAALNMLTVCQYFNLSEFKCKVWAYCPGYVVTNLTGENDVQNRLNNGAESPDTSAQGIKEIIEGQRDAEVNSFVTRYGKSSPW
jgi:NAD(P)-dependent dehydrogenase (short-subunit alcohol dehydrogenase family)